MKKILLSIALVLFTGVTLAGCTSYENNSSNGKQNAILEANQNKIIQNVPVPRVETSSDRKSIAQRAELFANENKISYVYLVNYGKVMSFYTIKGKVVSIRSYMTPQEQLIDGNGNPCGKYSTSCYAAQAPDIDGTYGDNADSIFFFTTDGAYVEWKGDYMVSDQPLKLTTQPELVREIK